nr:hypothetical protein [Trichocoleus sp. FACHB-591]
MIGPRYRSTTRRSSRNSGSSSSARQALTANLPPAASAPRICRAAAVWFEKN